MIGPAEAVATALFVATAGASVAAGVSVSEPFHVSSITDLLGSADVWAPVMNTALLVYLARLQIRKARKLDEVNRIHKETSRELVEEVKRQGDNGG